VGGLHEDMMGALMSDKNNYYLIIGD